MESLDRIKRRFGAVTRARFAVAGAVLLALPALVLAREGAVGALPGLVAATLFGTGLLAVAFFARRLTGGAR